MILNTPDEQDATGPVKDIYDADLNSLGYVPSHTKAMAINPEAYQAFQALIRATVANMNLRRYELVTLAAAQAIGSTHCRLAHGVKSLKVFSADQLAAIARDYHSAGLEPGEVAMMEYAEKLSTDAAAMTDEDTLALRKHGFSDREIMDITLAATARNFLSRTLLALNVELDVPPSLDENLQEALLAPLHER
ncbi:carboxymuconolactone decarboxylase family protein [Pseudarthrobacter sp. J75]|uniref:carboxymuconolactone decarboxylase family protein n=1 Tax=unclassified Pseudarthrobacter TaxID=2647000 RepID=UPI002E80A714|nr:MULTISPECIES: carboxymuconolactone decarboxylase family protein [unclassified Pseudarthrobacter]MEE2523981.1 carboxymuconolactone decarboxylase family protein [Pseudarthrobacter sp. J47]MEE2528251.1 carboxymuconolactone decarboxylase family protein [Pseudarthrobacter sp. J75]